MNVWLVEPYYTGSHRAWADGYQAHSRHAVHLLTMPGRFWKWRMQGGAVTLARQAQARADRPDLILASDMLNLPVFLALAGDRLARVPVALYFHENQLTYPLPPGEKRDLHYAFINWASALRADAVFFNSAYHLKVFFDELPRLLEHFPDYNELWSVETLRAKSQVLPLGLDLTRFDRHCRVSESASQRISEPEPCPELVEGLVEVGAGLAPALAGQPQGLPLRILWNHRWEYDKDPETFLRAIYLLADEGLDFGLLLLGRSFRNRPDEFLEVRQRLPGRLLHFGYVPDFTTYSRLLWQADVVVSTALHDFFGAAVVEACYCDCFPVLPRRLAYPELIPAAHHDACLYDDFDGLLERLRFALTHVQGTRAFSLRAHLAQFDWGHLAPRYDVHLAALIQGAA
jgi:glycosyltransferase involved in cell wall biosynthesis